MNILTITGRIGRDAEVRQSQNGTPMASFTVAVDMGYGERKTTEWMKCTLFGKRAESSLVQYLKKGQMVCVSGSAKANGYAAKDGTVKANIDIAINELDLIGKLEPKDQQQQPQGQDYQAYQSAPNDDVPF